eukprot:scaffold263_cov120-Isochrysis_galbana.AAC.16
MPHMPWICVDMRCAPSSKNVTFARKCTRIALAQPNQGERESGARRELVLESECARCSCARGCTWCTCGAALLVHDMHRSIRKAVRIV